ncbi:hypothetical protein [Thermosulfurimonas sp. F29]|uniref:hypothetical protein n=1 Tax=Thermosulfurimonas sp. F29 TaxID=2867247 RepID=UPI001C83FDCA|nr:hypothetical protein [Thermosulfurimonas sp. F29]MBX6423354.1 hypothetical protein [Thermosulfurimonas sp. F29]
MKRYGAKLLTVIWIVLFCVIGSFRVACGASVGFNDIKETAARLIAQRIEEEIRDRLWRAVEKPFWENLWRLRKRFFENLWRRYLEEAAPTIALTNALRGTLPAENRVDPETLLATILSSPPAQGNDTAITATANETQMTTPEWTVKQARLAGGIPLTPLEALSGKPFPIASQTALAYLRIEYKRKLAIWALETARRDLVFVHEIEKHLNDLKAPPENYSYGQALKDLVRLKQLEAIIRARMLEESSLRSRLEVLELVHFIHQQEADLASVLRLPSALPEQNVSRGNR